MSTKIAVLRFEQRIQDRFPASRVAPEPQRGQDTGLPPGVIETRTFRGSKLVRVVFDFGWSVSRTKKRTFLASYQQSRGLKQLGVAESHLAASPEPEGQTLLTLGRFGFSEDVLEVASSDGEAVWTEPSARLFWCRFL